MKNNYLIRLILIFKLILLLFGDKKEHNSEKLANYLKEGV